MPRRKINSILKIEYQASLGSSITLRTWQRIRHRLDITDDNDNSLLPIIRAYGKLKRIAPRCPYTRLDCLQYLWISQNFYSLSCTGYELLQALNRLTPKPTIATVYRWGKEIGCKFSVSRVYSHAELNLWLEKILTSRFRYEFKTNQRNS